MAQILHNPDEYLFPKILGKIFSYAFPTLCLIISVGVFSCIPSVEPWTTRTVFFFMGFLIFSLGIYLFIRRKSLEWY